MNAKKTVVSETVMDAAHRAVAHHEDSLEIDGRPWLDVLTDAHAEIVSALVLAYGGQIAAELCRQAARAIESIPTVTEAIAAGAQQVLDAERCGKAGPSGR